MHPFPKHPDQHGNDEIGINGLQSFGLVLPRLERDIRSNFSILMNDILTRDGGLCLLEIGSWFLYLESRQDMVFHTYQNCNIYNNKSTNNQHRNWVCPPSFHIEISTYFLNYMTCSLESKSQYIYITLHFPIQCLT